MLLAPQELGKILILQELGKILFPQEHGKIPRPKSHLLGMQWVFGLTVQDLCLT